VVHEELARYLDVVQEPFNVNRAALAAGLASLGRVDLVEERRRENAATRELLAALLREGGAHPAPSQANFVLADVGVDGVALADRLVRRGVLVRPGKEFGLNRSVRITVGPRPLVEQAVAEVVRAREELLGAPDSAVTRQT
jgi:histidinol-phosphate aminotransferase